MSYALFNGIDLRQMLFSKIITLARLTCYLGSLDTSGRDAVFL